MSGELLTRNHVKTIYRHFWIFHNVTLVNTCSIQAQSTDHISTLKELEIVSQRTLKNILRQPLLMRLRIFNQCTSCDRSVTVTKWFYLGRFTSKLQYNLVVFYSIRSCVKGRTRARIASTAVCGMSPKLHSRGLFYFLHANRFGKVCCMFGICRHMHVFGTMAQCAGPEMHRLPLNQIVVSRAHIVTITFCVLPKLGGSVSGMVGTAVMEALGIRLKVWRLPSILLQTWCFG